MHCIVLFGNEEFAGAGVIKKCCCAKEKTHLNAFVTDSCRAVESHGALCVAAVPLENSHFRVDMPDAQNNRAFRPM